jgi:hypothetical protein
MDTTLMSLIVVGLLLAGGAIYSVAGLAGLLPWDQARAAREAEERRIKPARDAKLFCPHCQQFGHVTTEPTTVKRGISGGKAAAALLTGGVTMLATGLSQEAIVTKATCSNCGSTWLF